MNTIKILLETLITDSSCQLFKMECWDRPQLYTTITAPLNGATTSLRLTLHLFKILNIISHKKKRVISMHAHWHNVWTGNMQKIRPLDMSCQDKIGTRNVMLGQKWDGSQVGTGVKESGLSRQNRDSCQLCNRYNVYSHCSQNARSPILHAHWLIHMKVKNWPSHREGYNTLAHISGSV